jgi:hypothetical protein
MSRRNTRLRFVHGIWNMSCYMLYPVTSTAVEFRDINVHSCNVRAFGSAIQKDSQWWWFQLSFRVTIKKYVDKSGAERTSWRCGEITQTVSSSPGKFSRALNSLAFTVSGKLNHAQSFHIRTFHAWIASDGRLIIWRTSSSLPQRFFCCCLQTEPVLKPIVQCLGFQTMSHQHGVRGFVVRQWQVHIYANQPTSEKGSPNGICFCHLTLPKDWFSFQGDLHPKGTNSIGHPLISRMNVPRTGRWWRAIQKNLLSECFADKTRDADKSSIAVEID